MSGDDRAPVWAVWRVHYATYQQTAAEGHRRPVQLDGPMTATAAMRRADALGFGHCARPFAPRSVA